MKKKVIFAVIAFLLICAGIRGCFESCSSDSDKVSRYDCDYVKAVEDGEIEEAYKIVNHYKNVYLRNYSGVHAEEITNRYWTAFKYVLKAEMQTIIPQNDEGMNARFVYKIAEINEVGKKPEVGEYYSRSYYSDTGYLYTVFIKNYNAVCDELLRSALIYKNRDMAERLVALYKEEISVEVDDKNYVKRVDCSWTSKDKAKKLINEAIAKGEL